MLFACVEQQLTSCTSQPLSQSLPSHFEHTCPKRKEWKDNTCTTRRGLLNRSLLPNDFPFMYYNSSLLFFLLFFALFIFHSPSILIFSSSLTFTALSLYVGQTTERTASGARWRLASFVRRNSPIVPSAEFTGEPTVNNAWPIQSE